MMPVVINRKSDTYLSAFANFACSLMFVWSLSMRVGAAETEILPNNVEHTDVDLSTEVNTVSVPYRSLADSLMHTASAQFELGIGEVRNLVIRGSHENVLQINGRQVLTAEGRQSFNTIPFESLPDNLLVLMPSAMATNVEVSTHIQPGTIEGASGGVLNMLTADPFDSRQDTFVVNFSGINTALPSDTGYGIFSQYANTFGAEKLGLVFSLARTSRERRQDGLDASRGFRRFGNVDNAIDASGNAINLDSNGDGMPGLVHRDIQFRQINDMRENTSFGSMLKWRPVNNLELYMDGFYSSIDSDSAGYGVGFFNCCLFRNPLFSENDVLLSANIYSNTDVKSDFIRSESTLLNSAIGLDWKLRRTKIFAELAFNDAQSHHIQDRYDFQTDMALPINFDFKTGEVPSLSYQGVDLMDASTISLVGVNNNEKNLSTSDIALRLDARWEFQLPTMLILDVGGRFNEMTHRNHRRDVSIGTDIGLVGLNNFTTKHASSNFFYADKHNIDLRYLVADHRSLRGCESLDEFFSEQEHELCLREVNPYAHVDIEEKLSAIYFDLKHQQQIAEKPLSVGLGARYVRRDLTSQAPGIDTIVPSSFEVTENKNDYVLPAFDLHFDLSENLSLTMAASKSIGLPATEALTGRIQLVNTTTAQAGNPQLDPMTVSQLSVSTRWHYADKGELSVAIFRKKLTAPFVKSVQNDYLVEGHNFPVRLMTTVNGPERLLDGIEWRYQQDLYFLPQVLDGFSTELNYAYIDSGARNNGLPIGVSRSNANAVLSYEKKLLAYRLAYRWRESYINETNVEGIHTFVHDYADLSATVSWNIDKNITMHFDAININNAREEQYMAFQEAVVRDLGVGRSYRLTLSVRH